jgi:hypothetical protein
VNPRRKKQPTPGDIGLAAFLRLLLRKRGDRLQLEAGYPPVLFVGRQRQEIKRPDLTDDQIAGLIREWFNSRARRQLHDTGVVAVIRSIHRAQFVLRAVDAFGVQRLDIEPLPPAWRR